MKTLLQHIYRPLFAVTFIFLLCYSPSSMAQIQVDPENRGSLGIQKFDTRTLSMGSATLADVYGRASVGINPSLSGLYESNSLLQVSMYHNWDNNLMQHSLTLPTLETGSHHFTARVGLIHSGSDAFNYLGTASLPEPDLEQYQATIVYAYALSNEFSVGWLQNVSYTSNEEAQFWTYSSDLGMVYAPEKSITYGLSFRGIGHETTYEIIETGQTTLGSTLLRQSLEVGATVRYPTEKRTYLSISFANEKKFGQDGLWYKGGVELLPFSFLAVRSGMMFNFTESVSLPRFGLGYHSKFVRLDYTVAPNEFRNEHFHQLGLTVRF